MVRAAHTGPGMGQYADHPVLGGRVILIKNSKTWWGPVQISIKKEQIRAHEREPSSRVRCRCLAVAPLMLPRCCRFATTTAVAALFLFFLLLPLLFPLLPSFLPSSFLYSSTVPSAETGLVTRKGKPCLEVPQVKCLL